LLESEKPMHKLYMICNTLRRNKSAEKINTMHAQNLADKLNMRADALLLQRLPDVCVYNQRL